MKKKKAIKPYVRLRNGKYEAVKPHVRQAADGKKQTEAARRKRWKKKNTTRARH